MAMAAFRMGVGWTPFSFMSQSTNMLNPIATMTRPRYGTADRNPF